MSQPSCTYIGIPGPKGTKGVKGPDGDFGPPGPDGLPGVNGNDGANGANGETGAIGPRGDRGPEGGTSTDANLNITVGNYNYTAPLPTNPVISFPVPLVDVIPADLHPLIELKNDSGLTLTSPGVTFYAYGTAVEPASLVLGAAGVYEVALKTILLLSPIGATFGTNGTFVTVSPTLRKNDGATDTYPLVTSCTLSKESSTVSTGGSLIITTLNDDEVLDVVIRISVATYTGGTPSINDVIILQNLSLTAIKLL